MSNKMESRIKIPTVSDGDFYWLSAERQNRTDDTAIFSRVLYQLSYLGNW